MMLPTDGETAEIVKPCKEALYLPTAPVAPQWPPVLSGRLPSLVQGPVRGNELDTAFFSQPLV